MSNQAIRDAEAEVGTLWNQMSGLLQIRAEIMLYYDGLENVVTSLQEAGFDTGHFRGVLCILYQQCTAIDQRMAVVRDEYVRAEVHAHLLRRRRQ